MIPEEAARKAAFWDQTICLDCGDTEGDPTEACEVCGGQHVYQGRLLVAVLDGVERGADGET